MPDPVHHTATTVFGREDLAAILDRPDPLVDTGDFEIDIPLNAIDPAPFNPKPKIFGPYRRGLAGSLGTFSLRDRLKVWPNPRSPGRYLVLDGNQRLDVLKEMVEDHLASLEAARRLLAEIAAEPVPEGEERPAFDPASKEGRKRLEKMFKAVAGDDAFMADCRAKSNSLPIPCRVMSSLDLDEAKLFTATFDRNRAKFDEGKLATLVDQALAAKDALGTLREGARKRIEAMTRPERPFIPPSSVQIPPTAVADPAISAPLAAATEPKPVPTVDADGEDLPWGEAPPPPAETITSPTRPVMPPQPPLVPVMFSLTAQAHAELTRGILLSTQRMVRSTRLKEAVDRFVDCSTEADLSEAAVEIALVCLQRRTAVAEAADIVNI